MTYSRKEAASKDEATTQTTKMIASAACSYSRKFILKGNTQLINNTYDRSQRLALNKAITDLRTVCTDYPEFSLEVNRGYEQFYFSIAQSKKLSIGNCYEMAIMALDYVVQQAPASVNAEVYSIEGGDHIFLVVGRAKNSDPHMPETWGEGAYISDPWSNSVYPASEYLNKTKNYYSTEPEGDPEDYRNHIEDFNKNRHVLTPVPLENTEYLRNTNSEAHRNKIIALFRNKMTTTIKTMEKLEINLNKIAKRLAEKYPNDPKKIEIIEKMTLELKLTIEKIKQNIEKNYTTLPYEVLRANLENASKSSLSSFKKAISVNAADKAVLGKYKDENSFSARLMRVLNLQPKTARDTASALKEAHEKVEKTLRRN